MGWLRDTLEGSVTKEGRSPKDLESLIFGLREINIRFESYKERLRQLSDTWGYVTEHMVVSVPYDKEIKASYIRDGKTAVTSIIKYLKDKNPERVSWYDYVMEFEVREKKKKRTIRINITKYPVKFEIEVKGIKKK